MNSRWLQRTLLLAVAVVSLSAPAHGAMVGLVPSAPSVLPGATFSLDVVVSDLGELTAPSLGAYDFEVQFDPSLVAFSSLEFGSGGTSQLDLGGFGSLTSFADGASSVVLSELSFDDPALLDSAQPGSFTAARLFFVAQASGVALFDLSSILLLDGLGESLGVTSSGATVTVAPVPLPAAIYLLLSALGVMGAVPGLVRVRRA